MVSLRHIKKAVTASKVESTCKIKLLRNYGERIAESAEAYRESWRVSLVRLLLPVCFVVALKDYSFIFRRLKMS